MALMGGRHILEEASILLSLACSWKITGNIPDGAFPFLLQDPICRGNLMYQVGCASLMLGKLVFKTTVFFQDAECIQIVCLELFRRIFLQLCLLRRILTAKHTDCLNKVRTTVSRGSHHLISYLVL
ncbi:hypothetical protein AOLI_G00225190 [Acnodon oligacanthus]